MNLEANKQNAIAYYKMAYEGNPAQAVADYVGDDYIQHNPDVADGKQGFIDYFERMQADYPNKSIEFVRCIAEGDLVALHTHQTWYEGEAINPQIMSILRWISSILTTTARLSSIGTVFRKSLSNRRMGI